MGDVQGPSISKHWDREKGRMTLLVRNGSASIDEATVEDSYPDTIAGVLCFARSGRHNADGNRLDRKDHLEAFRAEARRGARARIYVAAAFCFKRPCREKAAVGKGPGTAGSVEGRAAPAYHRDLTPSLRQRRRLSLPLCQSPSGYQSHG